jgi:hypothetical protein
MTTRAEVLEALPYQCVSLCLAALDEPVFILRGQDILAAKVVVRWDHLAEGAASGCRSKARMTSGIPIAAGVTQ